MCRQIIREELAYLGLKLEFFVAEIQIHGIIPARLLQRLH
jgi:hypothetical protein